MLGLACIVAGAMAAEAEKDLQTAEVNYGGGYGGHAGAGLGYAGGNLKITSLVVDL